MQIELEGYDPRRHDPRQVAELIVASDVELHSLTFGSVEMAVDVVTTLLGKRGTYYDAQNVRSVLGDGELVGVVVGYYGKDKRNLEARSVMAVLRALGPLTSLKKIPAWLKMRRLIFKDLPAEAYYVLNLAVDASRRGQGIGARVIDLLGAGDELFLDVNVSNQRARRFYEGNGFECVAENRVKVGGKPYGTYTMRHPPRD